MLAALPTSDQAQNPTRLFAITTPNLRETKHISHGFLFADPGIPLDKLFEEGYADRWGGLLYRHREGDEPDQRRWNVCIRGGSPVGSHDAGGPDEPEKTREYIAHFGVAVLLMTRETYEWLAVHCAAAGISLDVYHSALELSMS